MPVVTQPTVHGMHGSLFESFVSPSRGSTELCAWRTVVGPTQQGTAHRVDREEIFLVLGGEPVLYLDGRPEALQVGAVVFVPADSEVRLDNPGMHEATLWVTAVAGLQATTVSGQQISPPWAQ
ncbi:cupin domain-containing protein [Gordonia sp. DT30]|uniref:cupin domain-containing protein n=1 Tax=Gordonia sp. DT30 TaxID=3416546 RepID=UPI003CEAE49D